MDRDKVIKGFELCHTPGMNCKYCPYNSLPDNENCSDTLVRDVLALLKEQQKKKFFVDSDGKITPLPDVVQCKDCAYRGNKKKCIVAFVADKQDFPFFFYDNHGEWFCADGSRKDGEANGHGESY